MTFAKWSRSIDQPRECQVNNYCRICGYRLQTVQGRLILHVRTIAVLKKRNLNISCFGIIISTDVDLHAFPSKFCKTSYLVVQRHIKASSIKAPYRCMIKTYDWTKHLSHSCEVNTFNDRTMHRHWLTA